MFAPNHLSITPNHILNDERKKVGLEFNLWYCESVWGGGGCVGVGVGVGEGRLACLCPGRLV